MTDLMLHEILSREILSRAAATGGWFLAGALLGLMHFHALRWTADGLLQGRVMLSVGLQLSRFAVTGAALAVTARWYGAIPLLAGTLGMMVARSRMLQREPAQ